MPKIIEDSCKGCGICVDACQNNAITIENKKATINKTLCLDCELCVTSCPNGAIMPDRYGRGYLKPWPRPQQSYPLYYHPYVYRIYYPRFRRSQRGWH